MKRHLLIGAIAAALGLATAAALAPIESAAQSPTAQTAAQLRTATFVIDHMTCAACPITVRTVMSRVVGVRSVEVNFATKHARVTFDPTLTTLQAIARASTSAGYPARSVDIALSR